MKNTGGVVLLSILFLGACGESRSSETDSSENALAPAATGVSEFAASAANSADAAQCGRVDLAASETSSHMRFAAFFSGPCAGKNVLLLTKYPATMFPVTPGLTCVLLRSQSEIEKYSEFNFRCSGAKLDVVRVGGQLLIELPLVKGVALGEVKMRLVME